MNRQAPLSEGEDEDRDEAEEEDEGRTDLPDLEREVTRGSAE